MADESTAPEPNVEVQQWSGLAHYLCLHCGYNTLGTLQMSTHLRVQHQEQIVFKPASVPPEEAPASDDHAPAPEPEAEPVSEEPVPDEPREA